MFSMFLAQRRTLYTSIVLAAARDSGLGAEREMTMGKAYDSVKDC